MGISIKASDYREWEAYGLSDYGEFGDCVEYVNQEEDYADSLRGEWYYIPDEPLTVTDGPNPGTYRVIYSGTFSNDHSPGASHYVYAELFDVNDPADMEQFEGDKLGWERAEEFVIDED